MLYADHTQEDEYYNGGSLSYGSGGAPDNFAGWMMTWNYTVLQCKDSNGDNINPLRRVAEQAYGRPWTRMCPTYEVITNTFADKTHDSRYDGTFVTVYRANWSKEVSGVSYVIGADGSQVKEGEAILSFLPNDDEASNIKYPEGAGSNAIGAGVLAGRSDFVISPEGISRRTYPGLWKLGPYVHDLIILRNSLNFICWQLKQQ